MYTTGLLVEFKSDPLTGLIRALLKLFRSLTGYNNSENWEDEAPPSVAEDVEKMKEWD